MNHILSLGLDINRRDVKNSSIFIYRRPIQYENNNSIGDECTGSPRHLRRESRSCIKSEARKSRIILRNGNTRTSIFHWSRVSCVSSAALWEIFAESTLWQPFARGPLSEC